MASKVSFDPINRLIIISEAPDMNNNVLIDINIDIYSDGKEDWLTDSTLNKMKFPVDVIGGNEITEAKKLGATFFLQFGWKIKPYEADHALVLIGNMVSSDGTTPFVPTDGNYNVSIQREVSDIINGVASPSEIASIVWSEEWLPFVQNPTRSNTFGNRLSKKNQFGLFGK